MSTLKEQALRGAMKLLANPKLAKLLADPRLMTALTRGFELKSRVHSELDGKLRDFATRFNLVTRDDLIDLQNELRQVEARINDMLNRADADDSIPK